MYLIKYKVAKITKASKLKGGDVIEIAKELYAVSEPLKLEEELRITKIKGGGNYTLNCVSNAKFGKVIDLRKVGFLVEESLVTNLKVLQKESIEEVQ